MEGTRSLEFEIGEGIIEDAVKRHQSIGIVASSADIASSDGSSTFSIANDDDDDDDNDDFFVDFKLDFITEVFIADDVVFIGVDAITVFNLVVLLLLLLLLLLVLLTLKLFANGSKYTNWLITLKATSSLSIVPWCRLFAAVLSTLLVLFDGSYVGTTPFLSIIKITDKKIYVVEIIAKKKGIMS